jgi:hypothetical protein
MKKGSENIAGRLIPEGTGYGKGGIGKVGFPCKVCGSETKVIDSRAHQIGAYRRRECVACKVRYSTVEQDINNLLDARKKVTSILDDAKNQLDSIFKKTIIK